MQRGGVTVVYDGDGNRVSETVGGITTKYLVADQNLTGYAQVVDELQSGSVTRTYSYGLDLIAERQSIGGTLTTSFYGYDGHGSVRFLTDSTGAITDNYDYDAFGNLIASIGTTPNNYLFAGEQFDPALAIYYNRARNYDQRQGRFWTADTNEGDLFDAATLHKYLYVADNPVSLVDPSGLEFDLGSTLGAINISEQMDVATAKAEQAVGRRAIRTVVCEVGKCVVDLGIQEGVYIFMEEIAPGIVLPYIGQSGELAARIATHIRDGKIFGRLISFIEVQGGGEARRIVEQKIINALTEGGLQAGVRSLPAAERMISNLRNEIRLDKFINICK